MLSLLARGAFTKLGVERVGLGTLLAKRNDIMAYAGLSAAGGIELWIRTKEKSASVLSVLVKVRRRTGRLPLVPVQSAFMRRNGVASGKHLLHGRGRLVYPSVLVIIRGRFQYQYMVVLLLHFFYVTVFVAS